MSRKSRTLAGLIFVSMGILPQYVRAQDYLWTRRGPVDISDVTGVALDPLNPLVIYETSDAGARGATGIRKSLDGGQTWIDLGNGDPALMSLTRLVFEPGWGWDSDKLVVGSSQGLVATSPDGGATWSKATIGTNPISAIAVDQAASAVYAATKPTGYWGWGLVYDTAFSSSGDAGVTWQTTGLEAPRGVYALLVDRPGGILAGTDFAYYGGCCDPSGGGVAASRNGGATWALPSSDLGFSVTALTQSSDGAVFAATSSGQMLRSEDDGASWTPLGKLPGTVSSIVLDPAAVPTMYAALLHGGVWRSVDGGVNWRLFDAGLADNSVRSLAIDLSGRHLYAGTRAGVFHRELPSASMGPCGTADDHLCLLGSRFRVDLFAVDPRTGAPAPAKALSRADRFGTFALPSLTGDENLPEVVVKMLDATALPGQGYWLFSTALTNVPYSLAVTDTSSGRIQVYDGQAFCGAADVHAFAAGRPAETPAATLQRQVQPRSFGSELELLSGRFRVTVAAIDPWTGDPVAGVAIPQSDHFGYFSLPALTGDATFPEVFVKMLDATWLPDGDGDFWVFESGLTSLPYTLTVTDIATGASRTYRNEPVDPARLCGSADTRVTGSPAPTALPEEWVASLYDELDTSARASQSGERLSLLAMTAIRAGYLEGSLIPSSFDGALRGNSLQGVLRTQWQGCHFEGEASGRASSTRIEVRAEELVGTCGVLGGMRLELAPVP
jgi:hypothetical protein